MPGLLLPSSLFTGGNMEAHTIEELRDHPLIHPDHVAPLAIGHFGMVALEYWHGFEHRNKVLKHELTDVRV